MKKVNIILVMLSALALFTPVFSGYVVGIWMVISSFILRNETLPTQSKEDKQAFCLILRPISICALIFWALAIIAGIWAAWDSEVVDLKAVRHDLSHFGVKYVVLWFGYSCFFWRLATTKNLHKVFAMSYGVAAAVHGIYCVFQRQYGQDWAHGLSSTLGDGRLAYRVYRISGLVGHPLTLGYCLTLSLVACLALYRLANSRWEKNAWLSGIVWSIVVLTLSGSRGPQLTGLFVGALFLPAQATAANWKKVIVALVLLVGLGSYSGIFSRYFEVFTTASGGDMRMTHWTVHWRAFLDHMLHGMGPGSSKQAISSYYLNAGVNDTIKLAHNSYLQFAADYGLLGLLGATVWTISWGRVGKKVFFVKRAVWGLLSVILISSITQNTLQDSEFVYALTVWALVLIAKEVEHSESARGSKKHSNNLARQGG